MKKNSKKTAAAAPAPAKAKAKARRGVARPRVVGPSSRREVAEEPFRTIFADNAKTARKNLDRYAPRV